MLTTAFSYIYEQEATEETETISGLYEYHYTEQISLLFSLYRKYSRYRKQDLVQLRYTYTFCGNYIS